MNTRPKKWFLFWPFRYFLLPQWIWYLFSNYNMRRASNLKTSLHLCSLNYNNWATDWNCDKFDKRFDSVFYFLEKNQLFNCWNQCEQSFLQIIWHTIDDVKTKGDHDETAHKQKRYIVVFDRRCGTEIVPLCYLPPSAAVDLIKRLSSQQVKIS